MQKISILGLGWYGAPLARKLRKAGHPVYGSTRNEDKLLNFLTEGIMASKLVSPEIPPASLIESDVVVLNIPPFDQQLEWFKKWKFRKDTHLIFISSTSVYPQPETKNGELLKAQEDWVKATFKNWTILRFGGLIGHGRHPASTLVGDEKDLPGRLSLMNLIHQDDAVKFTELVIKKNLRNKTFHVVSDEHPTRSHFYTQYCLRNGLPIPEFDMKDKTVGKLVPNDDIKEHYVAFVKLE